MTNQLIEVKLQESSKNWTDHAKLGAELLGPLIAAVFGIWVFRLTKRIEQNQWKSQKLIEKRILIWDEVGPAVNDIYCYCKRIGLWKDMTPKDVIARKRATDKKVHLGRPYFSDALFHSYIHFTNNSFAMFQAHGTDAKIKAPLWEHKNARQHWEADWDSLFSDNLFDEESLDSSYELMLRKVQEELTSN
jgi:hypothetical protein